MLKITTDCFLNTPAANDGVKAAFQDHRLAKVVPTFIPGGFDRALAHYAEKPSPPLIILEADGTEKVAEQLDTLAEVCSSNTRLILLGSVNDVNFYRELKHHGIDDYLTIPFNPDQLTEVILEIYSSPHQSRKGQIIAVMGAKGGSGNSVIAQNLAFNLSQLRQEEALVIDLDLSFGSCDLGFNVDALVGIRNALAESERIDDVFLQRFASKYNDQLYLLGSNALLESSNRIDADCLGNVLDGLRQHMTYIVIDLPHTWDSWTQGVLKLADTVVLTVPMDLAALRNGRHLLEWLAQEKPRNPVPHVIANGMNPMIDEKDFIERLGAKNALVLPYDLESFRLAMSDGKMLKEVRPKAKSTLTLLKLAENIARTEQKPSSLSNIPSKSVSELLFLFLKSLHKS